MARGRQLSQEQRDEIGTLYLQGWNSRRIAAHFGLSKAGVLLTIKRLGCVRSSGEARTLGLKEYDIGAVKEILDGELLGDGAFAMTPNRTSARFDMTVGDCHREHVEYLAAIFQPYFPTRLAPSHGSYEYKGKRFESERLRLTTKFSPTFLKQRERWYGQGTHKRVPEDLVLTRTVLKHWYYGDGSMSNGVLLCTDRYTDEERARLMVMLEALGFPGKLYKARGVRNRIHMDIVTSRAFLEFIGESDLKCYQHKWNTQRS